MNKKPSIICQGYGAEPGPACLRDLTPEDGPALLALLQSGAAEGLFSGEAADLTVEHMQNFILAASITAGDDYRAVSDEEGAFLGLIGLKDMSPQRAEFCIALTPDARGKGLARAAAQQLLYEAFSREDGPERVFMYTRPDNDATCGFNRAMGFRPQAPEADAAEETAALNWYGVSREEFLAGLRPGPDRAGR